MFNSIQKEIEARCKAYEENKKEEAYSEADVSTAARNSAAKTPIGAMTTIDIDGATTAGVPGTDKVLIHTLNMDLVKCKSSSNPDKDRYYIRHNNRMKQYKSQLHDGDGHLASVITKVVAEDLLQTLTAANNRIKVLESEVSSLTRERDAYQFTVDTLRQNGVID